jgi:TIR domain
MTTPSNARYDAFLSYNSHDRPAVEELAGRLRAEGLTLYLEVWELLPGREFQPGLAEALIDSKTCTAFLGPNGLGPWQKEEIQVAIDKRVRDPDFHVIPVLLPGAERPRRGAVAHLEFLINASWVEFPKTLDNRRAFDSLVAGIRGIKPTLSPEEVKRWEGRRPYRGLEAFGPDDAPFFFGRESLTDWLVSDLRREIRPPAGVRFLAVLGPSGSGKSSVVLAGLIPRLKEGAIDGSERWPIAVVRPGDDPLKELGTAVAAQFVPAGSLPDAKQALQFSDDMRSDERMLDAFVRMALNTAPAEARLLVVVDQFEEVFTYRPEGEKKKEAFAKGRDAFFANLLHAAAAPGGRVAVVLTMRSDFLGLCASFERLNNVLNTHLIQVGPMRENELRAAIELPAFKVSCELEPGLTERLLADVKGQAGALPLLQFTLDELWQRREVRRLTLRAYTELGGVEGALEHRANETMQKLSQADQDLCRRIFLHLVQPGEGTEDTKRRVSYRELLPDDPERAEAVKRVVGILANRDARLITTQGTGTADGAVEVAHEALIRGWKQLRQWIDADRAGLRVHRQLTEAAQEWEADGRESSFLYGGTRLAVAREWAKTHRDELNALEAEFLAASRRKRQRKAIAVLASSILGMTLLAGGSWLLFKEKQELRKQTGATRLAARWNTDFNYLLLLAYF